MKYTITIDGPRGTYRRYSFRQSPIVAAMLGSADNKILYVEMRRWSWWFFPMRYWVKKRLKPMREKTSIYLVKKIDFEVFKKKLDEK